MGMHVRGRVFEPTTGTGLPGVVVNLLLPEDAGNHGMAMSFRGAKHRCLGSAHTDENGDFDLDFDHLDPSNWRCVQAMLVVETPRFLIDSDPTDDSNDRGELLQAMQLMLNPSGATGLSPLPPSG